MQGNRVLIVEDESIVAEDIKTSLQKMGYAVPAVVSTGEDAIEEAEKKTPDLVLMDIVLRGKINGIEAAGEIKSRLNIPVIFLTAYSDNNILEQAKITEPFGYITKPFENRELHSNIEVALYKHQIEKELRESREWLSTILNSIADAIIATDTTGLITYANPVAERLLGNGNKITGRNISEVCRLKNSLTKRFIKDPVGSIIKECSPLDLENHILVQKDPEGIPVDVTCSPILDQKSNASGMLLIIRDISQRVMIEKSLNEKVEELKKFYEMAIGRELKMKELKEEIRKLRKLQSRGRPSSNI